MIDRCDLFGKDVVLFATMSNSGGDSAIEKMEKKVKARGARVIEQFTIKTKDKSLSQLEKDSESIAQVLDLDIYK